jgi:tRNA threonylcarbamoyladenosine modification (KEOPS) complex  Pcc1 subunit
LTELRQVYGIAQNAITKLQAGLTTLILKNYKARIQISFEAPIRKSTLIAKSIYSALDPEIKLSSNSGVVTRISVGVPDLFIEIETDDIPKLRAIVNSYLRLVNAAYKCIVN